MKTIRMVALIVGAFVFLNGIFGITDAYSAGLAVTPSIRVEESWDSNVFNEYGSELSDFVTRVNPMATFSLNALGTTFNLGGGFEFEKYAKYNQLDRTAALKNVTFYPTEPIRLMPTLSLRPSAYFFETNDSTRRPDTGPPQEQIVVQQPPISSSETLTARRTKEREYSWGIQAFYTPTEKIEVDMRGWELKRQYLEGPPGVEDFRIIGAEGSGYYKITPRIWVGPYAAWSKTKLDGGQPTTIYQGSLAFRYSFSDFLTAELRAGASRSRQGGTPPAPDIITNAPYGLLSLNYNYGTVRATALGRYGIESGWDLATPTRTTTLDLAVANRFSDRVTGDLTSVFQRSNAASDNVAATSIQTYSVRGSLSYLAYRWMTLRLALALYRQDQDIGALHGDLSRKSVSLQMELHDWYQIY